MAFLGESQQHTLTDIRGMLVELRRLVSAHGEFLATFGQQTRSEENSDSLDERSPPRRWLPPPSVTQEPMGFKSYSLPRLNPPRFDGEMALDWICKVQAYYNHHYTPLDDRLYLTKYLFDPPATDWFHNYQKNDIDGSWEDFLVAVRYHFAPELIEEVDDEEQLGGSSLCAGIPNEVLDVDDVSQEFALELVSDDVPSNVGAPDDGVILSVASKRVTDSLFVTVPSDEVLKPCEFSSHGVDGDDALLVVKSAQIDLQYVATPTPSDSDYMESCLEQQALLGVGDQDLFRFEQQLSSDGRSIPPRNIATRLDGSFTTSWRPSSWRCVWDVRRRKTVDMCGM